MRTVEVVVVEDTAYGVAGTVKTRDRLTFGIDDLSLRIDLRTAEGGGHAAGKHKAVERSLFNGVRFFQCCRNSQFVGRTVMDSSIEFFKEAL